MNAKSKTFASFIIATSTIFALQSAHAVPPHKPDLVTDGNRWLVTAFNDSGPNQGRWATQGLCFFRVADLGTHMRYLWYSDTYPDWNGWARQEGDQIFMHGDWGGNTGHDGMEWEIVTNSPRNEGAGHWKEWRENLGFGSTVGFANAKFSRVGKCRYTFNNSLTSKTTEAEFVRKVDQYRLQYTDIEHPKSIEGREILSPSGNGLTNDIKNVLEAR